jgi:hypothetical protein
MECLLGVSLIKKGYRQISFLLIDPNYVFSSPEELRNINQVFKDFRNQITDAYLNTFKEHFAAENIRFLSRAQNISKYFSKGSNVAVVECLPPYAENIKDIQKNKALEKKPEELLGGSRIIPSNFANAIAFIPSTYIEELKKHGTQFTNFLPTAIFCHEQKNFYIDWGCKIFSDGNYHVSFTQAEHYLASLGIAPEQPIALDTKERIQAKDWVPKIRDEVEKMLAEEITKIKETKAVLSQEEISRLLKKSEEIATKYMSKISAFYSADYSLDRSDAMSFLSKEASHHFRKAFLLKADASATYKIHEESIA